jgi:hypothetical protein
VFDGETFWIEARLGLAFGFGGRGRLTRESRLCSGRSEFFANAIPGQPLQEAIPFVIQMQNRYPFRILPLETKPTGSWKDSHF